LIGQTDYGLNIERAACAGVFYFTPPMTRHTVFIVFGTANVIGPICTEEDIDIMHIQAKLKVAACIIKRKTTCKPVLFLNVFEGILL
jgi:hypothetical protein